MAAVSDEAQYVLRRIEHFLENKQSFMINQRQYPHLFAASSLTLEDLKVAALHGFAEKIVIPLELKESIEELQQLFPFHERLAATASETLKQLALFYLQTAKDSKRLDRSMVWIILAPKEQIASIPVQEVAELSDSEVSYLCGRLEKEKMPESAADTVGRLRASRVQEIAFDSLPLKAFRLLSKKQFAKLEFSRLSKEEIREALRGDGRAIEERWRALSQEDRRRIWKSVSKDLIEHFPREFYPEIDSITRGQLEDLFPPGWNPFSETNRERFALLTSAQVHRWIHLFWHWHIDLITDEQVRGLDFFTLGKGKVEEILSCGKDRMALLSSEQLAIVLRALGNSPLFKGLSIEQICALDFSKLSHEQIQTIFTLKKIPLIPVRIINELLGRLVYFIPYLSDEQIRDLEVEELSDKELEQLFPLPAREALIPIPEEDWIKEIMQLREPLSEEMVQRQLQARKELCQKRLGLIPAERLSLIRHRLHPKVAALIPATSP